MINLSKFSQKPMKILKARKEVDIPHASLYELREVEEI